MIPADGIATRSPTACWLDLTYPGTESLVYNCTSSIVKNKWFRLYCWRKGVFAVFGHPYIWDMGRAWGYGMYMMIPNVITVMIHVYEDIQCRHCTTGHEPCIWGRPHVVTANGENEPGSGSSRYRGGGSILQDAVVAPILRMICSAT